MENQENKRIETQASHTAMMAMIYRFLATKEDNEFFKGPDNLARIFLPSKAKFFLSMKFFRKIFRRKLHKGVPGSYEYLTARTKFFDDLFLENARNNTPQIVLLGAGYDTRSIRFKQYLNDTKVFELDVPTTQNHKIEILKKNKIDIPTSLNFVSINFNKDDIVQTLEKAGYDSLLGTLFIWEGVSMYVDNKAVDQTLSIVRSNTSSETVIAFDYLYDAVINGECDYYGAKELAAQVKEKGEGFSFGILEGGIENFLSSRSFNVLEHYTPEEFEKKYLYDSKGGFLGQMYGFACHVVAKHKN